MAPMNTCSPIDCLSEVLDDVPDLVFAFSVDMRYLYMNTAASRLLNLAPADIIGCHWTDVGLPEEVMVPLAQEVKRVFDTDQASEFVLTGSVQFGAHVWDTSLTPLRCENSATVCVLSISHDISRFVQPQDAAVG